MFGRKPRLSIDLILRSEKDSPPRYNHKEYLESWKKEMEGAFEVALTKSTGRKEKNVQRKLKSGPCLGILEPGDSVGQKFVIKRGSRETEVVLGTGGCRIQRHENDLTYTIKTISQPEKVRTLQRNMLMRVKTLLTHSQSTMQATLLRSECASTQKSQEVLPL